MEVCSSKYDAIISIRKAVNTDLPRIMEIYELARNYMRKTGNPNQWKNNFPSKGLLLDDINKGNLYVITADSKIHAVFAFIIGEDPTYTYIENGTWLSDTPYGTLHRIAGDRKIKGIFTIVTEFCEQKINHLRVDTHQDNQVMQHLICKNGFKKCGIIYVDDGTPRIAYERL